MQEGNNGWDTIAEKSSEGVEKQRRKEKFENGLNIGNSVLVIISIVCIIIIAAVIMAITGVNIFG